MEAVRALERVHAQLLGRSPVGTGCQLLCNCMSTRIRMMPLMEEFWTVYIHALLYHTSKRIHCSDRTDS